MSEQLFTVGKRYNWPKAALLAVGVTEAEIAAAVAAPIVAECHAAIDGVADRAFTSSASRAARYIRKEQEARAYVAAEEPDDADFPMLGAEAAARSMTVADLAADVIAAADAYASLAAQVEAARASARIAIEAAGTVEAMQAAARAAVAAVEAMVAG